MKSGITAALLVVAALSLSGCDQSSDEAQAAPNPKDYTTAFSLWRPLADKGDANAQYNLGLMYDNGQGVAQDYKEAARLWGLAAAQGVAFAQYNLGLMYANGQGVAQDFKEAVRLYRLAAAQGDADAQYSLGVMYDTGKGVARFNHQS